MIKKLLSIALVLCMCIALIPAGSINSYATDYDKDSFTFSNDGTLTLLKESFFDLDWEAREDGANYGDIEPEAVKKIIIKADDMQMDFGFFIDCVNLESIEVEGADSGAYTAVDGVLFNKNKTVLLAFPRNKQTENYEVPDGVKAIYSIQSNYLKSLTVPNSLKRWGYLNNGSFRKVSSRYWNHDLPKDTVLKELHYKGTKEEFNCISFYGYFDGVSFYRIPCEYFASDNINVYYDAPTYTGTVAASASGWAQAVVDKAVKDKMVPTSLQKNYKQAISRQGAAQLAINIVEQCYGGTIDDFLKANGVAINKSAFSDTSDKAVLAANALGIIQGVGGGKFNPNGTLTRAQIVAIISRTAEALGINTGGWEHMNKFADLQNHWLGAKEIGWASMMQIVQGVGGDRFNPNGELTGEQAVLTFYRAMQRIQSEKDGALGLL